MNKLAITRALNDMSVHSMSADAPASGLPRIVSCSNCCSREDFNIDYRLVKRRWVVSCDCGNGSGERRTLRAAIIAWNKDNSE